MNSHQVQRCIKCGRPIREYNQSGFCSNCQKGTDVREFIKLEKNGRILHINNE